jgi:uncharacterized membrane protein YccC
MTGWQAMPRDFHHSAGASFNPIRGAQVASALLLLVVVIEVLGRNRVSSSAAVGALVGVLIVAFCDVGRSLQIRARTMAAGAAGGALLFGLGSSIGGPWWVAVPALGLAVFISGALAVYGPVVAQLGVILTIVFAVALGSDGGPAAAVPVALGFLIGGTYYLVLALLSFVLRRPPHAVGEAPQVPHASGSPPAAPRSPFTLHSPVTRFALLRATATALVAGLAWGSGMAYPQWAPVVVIGSVRPDQMVALRLTTQRVVATVLGAGLAGVVLFWVHDPVVVAGLAVGSVFLAFAVKDENYTFFMFFLTLLTLLLLSLPTSGPTHAALAVLRVVTTLIGAVVALGFSWLAAWLERRASAPPHSPPEPMSRGAAV